MADRLFEVLTIGDEKVHELPEVAFRVEYEAKRNIDKKVASGSDDAVATDKGRHVRDLTIHLSWPDIPRINRIMGPILKSWSPGGPDGGKPWDFAHERNRLDLGDINAVRTIMFEEAKGPNVEVGSGVVTMEYKANSWVKPSAKADAGKTPDEDAKKKFVQGSELPNNGGGPSGGGGGTTPAPSPPDVKP